MFIKKILVLALALAMMVSCLVFNASAATEQEVLETVYELIEDEMYQSHNGFTFKMWKNESAAISDFSAIEDAVYVECDVFGALDTWYAAIHLWQLLATVICIHQILISLFWFGQHLMNGKIETYSKYNCPKVGQKNWDDSTEFFIYVKNELVHQDITAESYAEYQGTFEVKAGDQIMWTINSIGDMDDDSTNLNAKIWYTEVDVSSSVQTTENTAESQTPEISDTGSTTTVDQSETTNSSDVSASTDTSGVVDTTANSAGEDSSGLPLGVIIGIIAAAAVVVVIVIVVVKRKKGKFYLLFCINAKAKYIIKEFI